MNKNSDSTTLERRLRSTLLRRRAVLFAAGFFVTSATIIAISVLLSLLASIFVLPVTIKIALLGLSGLIVLWMFFQYAVGRLLSGSVESIAVDLETRYPELRGRLIGAIQFRRMKATPGYSNELMSLTEQQALQESARIDFNRAIAFYPIWRAGKALGVSLVIALLLLLLVPGLFTYSFKVYSNPTSVVAPPLGYRVVPFPGSVEWVKYRDIEIGASIFGDGLPSTAKIHYRLAGGSWQESETDLTRARRLLSGAGDSLSISLTLRQINKSFDYFVEAGRIKTEIQRVDVVDRPRVEGVKLSLFYPAYTSLPPMVIDENNGSFSAVFGSRVNVKITTNLAVEQAELVFSDSSRVPMAITGKEAEASLVVDKSQSYYVRLVDHLGEKNPDPIEYYMTAVPDEYPSIDVVRPGFDVNLGDEMILPLKVRIFDDYGFSSLVLKYVVVSRGRPSEENVAVLHFSDRIKTEGDIEFNWDMDRLNLFPGDYVSYCFEVADNDVISGPKVTRSRSFVARLPSLEEIVSESDTENTERISKVENLVRSGQELTERLKNAARKLKAQASENDKTDWQQQKEFEAVVDKNAEMVENIEKLAEQMDKSLQQLNDKALLSRELLEKLEQIQKLFEEVATPEMKEAQRKLMEALQSMDRQQLQDAIKDFQMSQEEMMERLERTLALLKKMQLEQKMEAVIRQVEELAKRQEQMNEQTQGSTDEDLPGMSEKEGEIKQSLEDLKKEVSNLEDMAREAHMEQSPEFDKFSEALSKTDADMNMQEMASAMNQKQKDEASSQGSQALTKLMQMLDTMQNQLSAMKGGQDDGFQKSMRMAIDDANYLSQSQEEKLKEAAAITQQSTLLHDMAGSQQDLMAACEGLKNRISELGRQSPFVAAELMTLVNNATQNMEMAMREFDLGRSNEAMRDQLEAMVNLNKTSLRLMESLDQQKQCQNGSNCNKNMSDLQGLSERQSQLNRDTKGACNNPSEGLDPGSEARQREALRRLAAEQESIRKSMEQLSSEFGDSRQILGRLDDIAREMREVEEALASGEAGSNVTDAQVKIYSRMLEASRSLYRRDFSEQRQAKTATNDIFYVPEELSSDILNDKANVEDRLRQYLGDNYPAQYEEQIKAYFRALLQVEMNANRQVDQRQPAESNQK